MFATRLNQENAIYEQQTAAATKNQGLKGLAPKTPGNKQPKTPFKPQRNNENVPVFTAGKANVKAGGFDRDAFVTPAGPRTRAPLGIKTTNAKALRTPAPLVIPDKPVSAKPSSPRLRRPKIKVHEAAPAEAEDILESDEDDIEYMPPRGTPLPDYPDDIWPHDRAYPQLQGQNLSRGWFAEYRALEDGDKDQDALSDLEERCRKIDEARRKQRTAGEPASTKHAGLRTAPTTLKAQNAALALANRPSKPATSVKSGAASSAALSKPASTAYRPSSAASGNPRFNAAKAVSKNTIGYSKGRAVSSFTRKPVFQIHDKPAPPKQSTANGSNALDDLLRLDSLDMGGDDDDDDDDDESSLPSNHRLGSLLDIDDELENFQLKPAEEA